MNSRKTYLKELSEIRSSGAAVMNLYYDPLGNLLNEIGKNLKPEVSCIINLRNWASTSVRLLALPTPTSPNVEDGCAQAVVILDR